MARIPVATQPKQDDRRNKSDWLIASVIAAGALALYAHTWSFDFTNWDDGAYITNNRNLSDVDGLRRIWFSAENEQYYPLTFTTYWIEHQIWGDDPTGYHVVNTALHALNVYLVYFLGRRLGLSALPAGLAAGLFAAHPMQAMSVAWVAERKTLLASFFLLLATHRWIAFRKQGERREYVSAILFFALGLLSKTAIVLAPLAWLVLDVAWYSRPIRKSLAALLPMLAMSVAAMVVTRHFESGFIDAQALAMIPTPAHRIALAATAPWWYVWKLLAPLALSPVYPLWNIVPAAPSWWLGAIAIALTLVVIVRWRGRLPAGLKFGLAWFVLLLVPMLGLVAYGNLAVSPTSNHYVYISCIGLFIAVASIMDPWVKTSSARLRLAAVSVLVLLIAAAVAARSEASAFRNSKSLWTAALARDANCFPAHLGLGQEALGDKNLPRALAHYSAAARIRPAQYEGHAGVGEVYTRLQQWNQARESFDTALAMRPHYAPVLLGRGTVAEHDGDLPRALELTRRANAIDAYNPRAALQLGVLILRMVNQNRGLATTRPLDVDEHLLAEARQAFAHVIALRPADAAGYRGAVECDRLRRDWASAIDTARAGLAAEPSNIPLKNLLAITLARCPDDRLRDGPAAVRLAEEIAGALGDNYQLLETLASAYASVDRFEDAVRVSHDAARLARALGHEPAAKANESWAAQYEAHKPRLDSSR